MAILSIYIVIGILLSHCSFSIASQKYNDINKTCGIETVFFLISCVTCKETFPYRPFYQLLL